MTRQREKEAQEGKKHDITLNYCTIKKEQANKTIKVLGFVLLRYIAQNKPTDTGFGEVGKTQFELKK